MKGNVMKKLTLFAAAVALCATVFAKPVDVNAAAAAPINLQQVGATDTAVSVTWTTNVASDAYEVQISSTGQEATYVTKTYYATNGYNIYSLNPGSTYFVRVRGRNSASDVSAWSTIKVDTAPSKLASGAVKQTTAGKTSVTVKWPAAAGATGYYIYKAATGTTDPWKYVGATTSTSYKVSGLPKDSQYDIAVLPYRNAANKDNVAIITKSFYSTACVTTPSAPKKLYVDRYTIKKGKYGTQLYWKPVSTSANTDGYQIEVYTINKKGKASRLVKKTVKGYVHVSDGSTNYGSYKNTKSKLFTNAFKYRVRPYVTINGKKVYGSWSSYCQYVPGAFVKKLTRSSYGATTGKLTWKKVEGAKYYDVYWKSSKTAKWKRVAKKVKGTSATVKYKPYTIYNYYYIRAYDVKIGSKKYDSPKHTSSKAVDIWNIYSVIK